MYMTEKLNGSLFQKDRLDQLKNQMFLLPLNHSVIVRDILFKAPDFSSPDVLISKSLFNSISPSVRTKARQWWWCLDQKN